MGFRPNRKVVDFQSESSTNCSKITQERSWVEDRRKNPSKHRKGLYSNETEKGECVSIKVEYYIYKIGARVLGYLRLVLSHIYLEICFSIEHRLFCLAP